jgi:hypothetical protein
MIETVSMTDPARAKLKAIIAGLTMRRGSFADCLGWQNTIAAPRQVDMPAIVDR